MWEKPFSELSSLAGRQEGLITAAQANRSNIPIEALVHFKQAALIAEIDWNVYQLASSQLGARYAYPLAAWLGLRPERFQWERLDGVPDAVLSHEAACSLHQMGTIAAPLEVFTTPEERDAPPGTRIHVEKLAADAFVIRASVPVTTPRRTIVDLVRDWTEHADVANVLADAVRQDLVDLRAVHSDLAPLAVEHEFPAEGRDFIAYFMPSLSPAALSETNKRAYAILTQPERVAELRQSVQRLLADAGAPRDEALSLDLAAEIAARTARR